jgi:hypothetical protein
MCVCNLSQINKSDNLPDVVLWNIGLKNSSSLVDVEVLSLLGSTKTQILTPEELCVRRVVTRVVCVLRVACECPLKRWSRQVRAG